MSAIAFVLAALLIGALMYSLLSIIAALRYLSVRPPAMASPEPVSILKPLSGLDLGLEANLRTFFEQDYPAFEILFAVREAGDPAVAVVEKLQSEYARIPSRLFVAGESPYPNAKAYSLNLMLAAAANDLVVMSESVSRVTSTLLSTVTSEFQDVGLGIATCPYRAVAGKSFWSRLEATGMNTDFIGARQLAMDGADHRFWAVLASRCHFQGSRSGPAPIVEIRPCAQGAQPAPVRTVGRFLAPPIFEADLAS